MTVNVQQDKKKRLLMLAGIIVIPFGILLIVFFIVFHGHKKPVTSDSKGTGFNAQFPAPNLPKREKTKLEAYMQAEQDSIRLKSDRSKNPYANLGLVDTGISTTAVNKGTAFLNPSRTTSMGEAMPSGQDENDKNVNDRLHKLYNIINTPGPSSIGQKQEESVASGLSQTRSPQSQDIERLMQSLHKDDSVPNPQLTQVKQILDEIKDIQNPQRPKPVQGADLHEPPLLVSDRPILTGGNNSANEITSNGFLGLNDELDSTLSVAVGNIQAVVHEDQTVQTGSIAKLRLLQPIYIGDQKIPANSFIYGPASISGERVSIQLTNAIYNGKIYPISLKVYDGSDGLEGLYVPGMITRDVVKQNMSQGVNGLTFASLDPSLGAQAATAAIETARNLMTKKISLLKATLKTGHVAILKQMK